MKLWYIHLLVLLIVTWLSIGTAHTDMEGEWLFDKPVSAAMKAKIREMGPGYFYRTLHDGTFQVNRGEGWERLRV